MSDRARVMGATSGALSLGGFAAALGLCCSFSWAVAVLGVTGAIALARLAFLLPYALFGAAALLVGAFWVAYRPGTACADGTCAVAPRGGLRFIVWIVTALLCALAVIVLKLQVTSP